MSSALLNIWRENGAYLRYGDAKVLFLLGLSVAILFSFLGHIFIVSSSEWVKIKGVFNYDFNLEGGVSFFFFALSAVVSFLALVPTLSNKMIRVSCLCTLGCFFSRDPMIDESAGAFTFRDIAKYGSGQKYIEVLQGCGILKSDCSDADRQLAEQIWVISKIAFSKFVAVNISVISLLVGFLVFLFSS